MRHMEIDIGPDRRSSELLLTLRRRRNNNSFSAGAWFPRERDRTAYVAQGRVVMAAVKSARD